jgi:hypothetical protein
MIFSQWMALRKAREALRVGQPEIAWTVIKPFVDRGSKPALEILDRVVQTILDRAERALRNDDVVSAWKDLIQAEGLKPAHPHALHLRKTLTQLGLAAARAALISGNPRVALDILTDLTQRSADHAQILKYRIAAENWLTAESALERSDFLEAETHLAAVYGQLELIDREGIDRFRDGLLERKNRVDDLLAKIPDARQQRDWQFVVALADQILAYAPRHAGARKIRDQAWERLQQSSAEAVPLVAQATRSATSVAPLAAPVSASKRFLLWIDGVGGYLVCLGNRVTLGQAGTGGPVDIPLFADVSRIHAEIHRDGSGYVIDSQREITINGSTTKRTVLTPGDRITLGTTCQMVFSRPVSMLTTGRLDLVSGHRLPIAVDAVLLMAENLIIGPGPMAHIPVPGLAGQFILYRAEEKLAVRYAGTFLVDDQPQQNQAVIPWGCHLEVPKGPLRMTLEPYSPRPGVPG